MGCSSARPVILYWTYKDTRHHADADRLLSLTGGCIFHFKEDQRLAKGEEANRCRHSAAMIRKYPTMPLKEWPAACCPWSGRTMKAPKGRQSWPSGTRGKTLKTQDYQLKRRLNRYCGVHWLHLLFYSFYCANYGAYGPGIGWWNGMEDTLGGEGNNRVSLGWKVWGEDRERQKLG